MRSPTAVTTLLAWVKMSAASVTDIVAAVLAIAIGSKGANEQHKKDKRTTKAESVGRVSVTQMNGIIINECHLNVPHLSIKLRPMGNV